jgi:tetratricopeptide (TPR) repeat protein
MRPESVDALRGLAALSLAQQDYNQAFSLHKKLLDLGERSAELFYNAGLIAQKRSEMQDAAKYYEQALQQQPQFAEALLNLGHVRKALGQEEEARNCWRKAVEAKPELAETYFEPSAQ